MVVPDYAEVIRIGRDNKQVFVDKKHSPDLIEMLEHAERRGYKPTDIKQLLGRGDCGCIVLDSMSEDHSAHLEAARIISAVDPNGANYYIEYFNLKH